MLELISDIKGSKSVLFEKFTKREVKKENKEEITVPLYTQLKCRITVEC